MGGRLDEFLPEVRALLTRRLHDGDRRQIARGYLLRSAASEPRLSGVDWMAEPWNVWWGADWL